MEITKYIIGNKNKDSFLGYNGEWYFPTDGLTWVKVFDSTEDAKNYLEDEVRYYTTGPIQDNMLNTIYPITIKLT